MNEGLEKLYDLKSSKYSLTLGSDAIHSQILGMIGAKQKVLDVGCAAGYLGKLIKEKGNEVYGVELSPIAAEEARKYLDDVMVGNIESIKLPYPSNYFDIIICADILEHLFDPVSTLKKLKKYLKEEGDLLASVPNVVNWWVRKRVLFGEFEYSDVGLLDSSHIRFFTFKTAKKMFEEAGYEIVKTDCSIFLPAILSWLDKYFNFIARTCKRFFPGLFALQYLFVIRRKKSQKGSEHTE